MRVWCSVNSSIRYSSFHPFLFLFTTMMTAVLIGVLALTALAAAQNATFNLTTALEIVRAC